MRLRGAYVARRILYALIALFAVIVLNFLIPRAVPGNPVEIFANPRVLPAIETKILTQRFGLNKPCGTSSCFTSKEYFSGLLTSESHSSSIPRRSGTL